MRAVGVTGHQNAPWQVWNLLAERLPDILGAAPFVGVSSLAAGADQEFARHVLALGGELIAVIPSHGYEESFETPAQRQLYLSLLAKTTRREELAFPCPSEDAYLAAGKRVVQLSDTLVAVWDGERARGKGGTADIVSYARGIGKNVTILWPDGVTR